MSGHTQVDGPSKIVDKHPTESNKAQVTSFVHDVLVNHRVEQMDAYVSANQYIQHSPLAPDIWNPFLPARSPTVASSDDDCPARISVSTFVTHAQIASLAS